MPIIELEKALDIFKYTNKIEAESFANDSWIRRDDIVAASMLNYYGQKKKERVL